MTNKDELRALASKAIGVHCTVRDAINFQAAATPEAVIALLDRIEELEAHVEKHHEQERRRAKGGRVDHVEFPRDIVKL